MQAMECCCACQLLVIAILSTRRNKRYYSKYDKNNPKCNSKKQRKCHFFIFGVNLKAQTHSLFGRVRLCYKCVKRGSYYFASSAFSASALATFFVAFFVAVFFAVAFFVAAFFAGFFSATASSAFSAGFSTAL